MNLKKLPVWGLFLALAGVFFMSPSYAQESELVQVKTNIIQPISIDFLPSKSGVIKGQLSGMIQEAELQGVVFSIENLPSRDEIWRETILWEDSFQINGEMNIPFQFDLSKIPITEKFVLFARVVDEKTNVIAKGSAGARIPESFAETSSDFIKDLALEVEAGVHVSFVFVNGAEAKKIKPELTLLEHTIGGDEKFSLRDSEFVEVAPNEERVFQFSFSKPSDPENYIVSVRVVDHKENPVTGYLRSNFLVEGDFAEIKALQITPAIGGGRRDSVIYGFRGCRWIKR